jgi:hypothetical protein
MPQRPPRQRLSSNALGSRNVIERISSQQSHERLVAISDKMNSNLLRACRLALFMTRTLSPISRNREFPSS